MIGWWRCRRQAEAAILRRELRAARLATKFYRDMSARLARENEHYKRLAAARGVEQDAVDSDVDGLAA